MGAEGMAFIMTNKLLAHRRYAGARAAEQLVTKTAASRLNSDDSLD